MIKKIEIIDPERADDFCFTKIEKKRTFMTTIREQLLFDNNILLPNIIVFTFTSADL